MSFQHPIMDIAKLPERNMYKRMRRDYAQIFRLRQFQLVLLCVVNIVNYMDRFTLAGKLY